MNSDSYQNTLEAVRAFHLKHDFRSSRGEDLTYRVALMSEEMGEISACVTKGKQADRVAEECADLFILPLGTAVSANFDLRKAFWEKMRKVELCGAKFVDGRIRKSEFRD